MLAMRQGVKLCLVMVSRPSTNWNSDVAGKSLTPHIEPPESPEPESPSTPTFTNSARIFFNRSRKTPPRQTQPEQRPSSVPMDQLPNYDYTPQISETSGRHSFEEGNHSIYDASYLTQV